MLQVTVAKLLGALTTTLTTTMKIACSLSTVPLDMLPKQQTRECRACGIPLFDDEHIICNMCSEEDYEDEDEEDE